MPLLLCGASIREADRIFISIRRYALNLFEFSSSHRRRDLGGEPERTLSGLKFFFDVPSSAGWSRLPFCRLATDLPGKQTLRRE